jgi:hypothetical protein
MISPLLITRARFPSMPGRQQKSYPCGRHLDSLSRVPLSANRAGFRMVPLYRAPVAFAPSHGHVQIRQSDVWLSCFHAILVREELQHGVSAEQFPLLVLYTVQEYRKEALCCVIPVKGNNVRMVILSRVAATVQQTLARPMPLASL